MSAILWIFSKVFGMVRSAFLLHRHKLRYGPEERLLEGNSHSDEGLCTDDSVDIGCNRAGDGTQEAKERPEDEKPPSTEDIRKLADHEEEHSTTADVDQRNPVYIW